MRRALAAVPFLVAALACGCGAESVPAPTSVKAPPQTARLAWEEPYPATDTALVFGVSSFTVTRSGWSADVSVENRSKVGWEMGVPSLAATRQFGVLLFPSGDLQDLERRNHPGDMPALRAATTIEPALPLVLAPGSTWRARIGAPGPLAGGLWVRLSFGPLVTTGEPPPGMDQTIVWYTDHAHRLQEVDSEPS